MKDIFGKTLEVGQTVAACCQFGKQGYELLPAVIVSLTPSMVRIQLGKEAGYYAERPRLISTSKLAIVETL